jgi:hypothetical protein
LEERNGRDWCEEPHLSSPKERDVEEILAKISPSYPPRSYRVDTFFFNTLQYANIKKRIYRFR